MLVVIVVLLVGAIVVWTQILKPAPPLATGCNEPGPAPTSESANSSDTAAAGTTSAQQSVQSTASVSTTGSATESTGSTGSAGSTGPSTSVSTTLGTFVDPNVLAATRPADPSTVPVRVLNASDVTGQAKTVTDELRRAGFSSILQQANDPLYPAWDLRCYGEIRYGYAGLAEARAVLMVAPCAQLVRDDRQDNSVDLSLGKLYQVKPISKKVLGELTAIKNAAAPPPVIEGQTVSVRSTHPIPPLPDRSNCPG